MYDILVILKKSTKSNADKIGNDIKICASEGNQAWCGEISVTQSEFYAAAARQFKPEKVLEIWDRDYNSENRCIIDGIEYEIYRTFRKKESTKRELYLRVSNGGN